MTDDEIDALRALEAAATPGPWFYDSYSQVYSSPRMKLYSALEVEHEQAGEPWGADDDYPSPWKERFAEVEPYVASVEVASGDTATKRGSRDAQLIEAMRNAIPALLDAAAEANRLRAVLEAAKEYQKVAWSTPIVARMRQRRTAAWALAFENLRAAIAAAEEKP